MIKIKRTDCPDILSDLQYINEQIDLFKNNDERVWNNKVIKDALLSMSFRKCCYCEIRLSEEGKDMQVEHFHPKSLYPNEVITWSNLLPACNRCNRKKSAFDTKSEPIIDPTEKTPSDYLYMKNYRYKSIEPQGIGKNTIDVLCLNDSNGLVLPRFKIGEKVQEKLEDLLEKATEFKRTKTLPGTLDNLIIKKQNKLESILKGLLGEAKSSEEYSATVATTILEDDNYHTIKKLCMSFGLWDSELIDLEAEMKANSLAK